MQLGRGYLLILNLDCRFKNSTRPELLYAYLNKDQLPSEWPTSMSVEVRFLAYIEQSQFSFHITSMTAIEWCFISESI